ncbi:MAG: hypothetical protein KF803_16130 [Cyclobacteriaceae bacterium]|nr:hypothetical protein [Cyclobacteriaceae bacterium]
MKALHTLLVICCFATASAQEINLITTTTEKPLFVINGKHTTYDDLSHIKPNDIESIHVLKNEKAIDQFGEAGKNGVVVITLKHSAKLEPNEELENEATSITLRELSTGVKPLFVFDGKIIQYEDIEKLDKRNIEAIEVLKGEKATDQYGDKGKNGVVVIKSKKAPMKIRQSDKE